MDLVVMTYYASICGVLGLASPQVRHPAARFVVGVAIGAVAARLAPVFRALVGAG